MKQIYKKRKRSRYGETGGSVKRKERRGIGVRKEEKGRGTRRKRR